MAAARRLKVYQAAFGFRDSVVAAANQKAALQAWGARQNLFAEGLARIADDPAATKAALARPGTPLSRPVGSSGPFTLDDEDLPVLPDAPKRPAVARASAARPPPPSKPPDRSRLDTAEAAVSKAEADRDGAEREFRARADALAREQATTLRRLEASLTAAKDKAEAARRDFRAVGGES